MKANNRHMSRVERKAAYEEAVKRNKQVAGQMRQGLSRIEWFFIAGLAAGAYSITIHNQTIISSLFWLPIVVLSILLTLICLARANKITFWKKLQLGTSIGMFLTLGFLFVNYHFADWNSKPEVSTYKVVETGVYHRRYGISYRICVDLGDMEKNIRFTHGDGYDDRILDSRIVQLRLHQGRLGYKVYKEKRAQ